MFGGVNLFSFSRPAPTFRLARTGPGTHGRLRYGMYSIVKPPLALGDGIMGRLGAGPRRGPPSRLGYPGSLAPGRPSCVSLLSMPVLSILCMYTLPTTIIGFGYGYILGPSPVPRASRVDMMYTRSAPARRHSLWVNNNLFGATPGNALLTNGAPCNPQTRAIGHICHLEKEPGAARGCIWRLASGLSAKVLSDRMV